MTDGASATRVFPLTSHRWETSSDRRLLDNLDDVAENVALAEDSLLARLPLEVFVLLGCVTGYVFLTSAVGALRWYRRKRRGQPAKFVGPGKCWLSAVSRCPLLMLLLSLLVPLTFSFLGARASGYSVAVDMDITNYMRADSEMKWLEDAVNSAVETNPNLKESSDTARLLSAQEERSDPDWCLDLFYEAKDGSNIFTAAGLNEIRAFEQSIKFFAGYSQHCLQEMVGNCSLPDSAVNVFYKTEVVVNDSHAYSRYDGEGELANIEETLLAFAKMGISWWVDKHFNAKHLSSRYTRSRFCGVSGPEEGAHTRWLISLYRSLLLKANSGHYKHIVVTWYEDTTLWSLEFMDTLKHDALWSLGTFAFIVLFLYFEFRKVFLTAMAIASVLLSFSVTFYVYIVIAQYSSINVINFLALFLVTGIAVDDVMVIHKTYSLSSATLDLDANAGPQERIRWTIPRAGWATLVTTVTTSGSFFSLYMSSLPIVRSFGLFMGTLVVLCFVNIMCIFPCALVLSDLPRYHRCCRLVCCCRRRKNTKIRPLSSCEDSPKSRAKDSAGRKESKEPLSPKCPSKMTAIVPSLSSQSSNRSLDSNELGYVERSCMQTLVPRMWCVRHVLCLIFLVAGIICGWRAYVDLTPADGTPVVFSEKRNIGRLGAIRRDVFSEYSKKALDVARSTLVPLSTIVNRQCPGSVLLESEQTWVRCSNHGTCNMESMTCSCDDEYVGRDCSVLWQQARVGIAPELLRIAAAVRGGQEVTDEVVQERVTIFNDGDEVAAWLFGQPNETWVTLGRHSGELGPRQEAPGGMVRTSVEVDIAVNLTGRAAGWVGEATVALLRTNDSAVVKLVRVLATVVGTPALDGIRLRPGASLAPSFDSNWRTYFVNLPFRVGGACVSPSFQWPTEAAAVEGALLDNAACSPEFYFEPGVERRLQVDAMSLSAGVNRSYLLTVLRAPPRPPGPVELQRVVAGDGLIEVTFSPTLALDADEDILGYEIVAIPAGSRLLTEELPGPSMVVSAPCAPAPCWSHEDAGPRLEDLSCCRHFVSGLENGQAYSVMVRAVTQTGSGEPSIPTLSEGGWPWMPVTPQVVPDPPAITAPPLLEMHDGEASLTIQPSSIVAGGAVPLGQLSCVARPGGATGSSTSGLTVRIAGLEAIRKYNFVCRIANARGAGSGITSDFSPEESYLPPASTTSSTTTIAMTHVTSTVTFSSTTETSMISSTGSTTTSTVTTVTRTTTTLTRTTMTETSTITLTSTSMTETTTTLTSTSATETTSTLSSTTTETEIASTITTSTITTSTITTSTMSTTTTFVTVTSTTTAPPVPRKPRVADVSSPSDGQIVIQVSTRDEPVLGISCSSVEDPSVSGDALDPSRTIVLSGLPPGSSYSFRCTTWNSVGSSLPSRESEQVVVVAVPGAPEIRSVHISGEAQLTVEVIPPLEEPWPPLQLYRCSAVGHQGVSGEAENTSVVVSGLQPGTAYSFRCRAANQVGQSPRSAASPPVTAVAAPPAPVIACVSPGDAQAVAHVADAAPSTDPRFGRVVAITCAPADAPSEGVEVVRSEVSAEVQVHLRGLANGRAIRMRCAAHSEAGLSSAASTSAPVMPGVPVVGTFALEGSLDGNVTEEILHGWLAEELAVPASSVVADLAAEGDDFDGCTASTDVSSEVSRRLQQQQQEEQEEQEQSIRLQVRVMMLDSSDPNVTRVLHALANLTGIPAIGLQGPIVLTALEPPYLAASTFSDTSLRSLSIQVEGAAAQPVLQPSFDPEIQAYRVNITTLEYTVQAAANSTFAFPVEARDANEIGDAKFMPATFQATRVAPLWHTIKLKVVARTMMSSEYLVHIQLLPKPCSLPCGNGTCDLLTGYCQCDAGWFGNDCQTFCPGDPPCAGRGTCQADLLGCECSETFAGPHCLTRVCPNCSNGGECLPGTQALNSSWGCRCGANFTGPRCEQRTCPGNCSGGGECDPETGSCACYPQYYGDDCSMQMPILHPITGVVEISLVWGIRGYHPRQKSMPVYDTDFHFEDAETQRWILQTSREIRSNPLLKVRAERDMFIEYLFKYLAPEARGGFPLAPTSLQERLYHFFTKSNYWRAFHEEVGTSAQNYSGRILFVRSTLRINVLKSAGVTALEQEFAAWDAFVTDWNSRAPIGAKMLMVSQSWTRMSVEKGILESTVRAFAVSVLICSAAVLIFTGNVMLSLLTVLSTVLVMLVMSGFIMSVLRWEFGAIQAIGMTTFVGMGVDYALHLSHAYHTSVEETRQQKVSDAVVRVGPAILCSAATTAGATAFLLPCWIHLFYQLGVLLCASTIIALSFAFFFLAPALMIFGPVLWRLPFEHTCGDLLGPLRWLCRRLRLVISGRTEVVVIPARNMTPVLDSESES